MTILAPKGFPVQLPLIIEHGVIVVLAGVLLAVLWRQYGQNILNRKGAKNAKKL